jgi:hypothetical protein
VSTEGTGWLREQITGRLGYARKIAAMRPIKVTPNRMADLIATCEAELAILDEHEARGWQLGDRVHDCQWETWPCLTIRHLASAYRHKDGYGKFWGQE